MRFWERLFLASLPCLLCGGALARDLDFTAIPPLTERDRIAAAKLPAAEVKQVLDQVEQTSFDTPESWQAELRWRRLSISGGDGLVVRGTEMLCGGTGNCETWLFRRANGGWVNMFDGEAPVISSFGFGRHVSHDVPDLIATAPLSAGKSNYVVYVFEGKFYRSDWCYEIDTEGAKKAAKKVARP